MGKRFAKAIDGSAIVVERVRTSHATEHCVARMLKRQMEGRRHGTCGRQLDERLGHIHRLQRSESDEELAGAPDGGIQKIGQSRWLIEIAPISAEVDAGQGDFEEAARFCPSQLLDDSRNRLAARHAASGWDDAVAAALLTSGLHPDGERRALK